MLRRRLHTLVCMIIESSRILESLLTCLARKNHSFLLALHLELVREFLEMNTDKVDKPISLTNIFIIASLARAFERILNLKRLRMLKLNMNIKNTLLREALGAMLARVGKNPIMSSKMIVHCRLILTGKLAVVASKLSVAVLGVDENHLCWGLMPSTAARRGFQFLRGGRGQPSGHISMV